MEIIDTARFFPLSIKSGKQANRYHLCFDALGENYYLHYKRPVFNKYGLVGKRIHDAMLPKEITFDEVTYYVLGLLQGEMSKTHRQMLTFASCDPAINNAVLDWFERENISKRNEWSWYVKINLAKPKEVHYDKLASEVLPQWLTLCGVDPNKQYRTGLTFSNKTTKCERSDIGTLMIEHANPIFVQFMQLLVKLTTQSIAKQKPEYIREFMRGIIAAEGSVDYHIITGHRRVYVTACKEHERAIFRKCFRKLGLKSKDCKPIKDIIISGRENLLRMDELDLMTGHPEKHAKFKEMLSTYTLAWHENRKKV